jgi:hypothetical protein
MQQLCFFYLTSEIIFPMTGYFVVKGGAFVKATTQSSGWSLPDGTHVGNFMKP